MESSDSAVENKPVVAPAAEQVSVPAEAVPADSTPAKSVPAAVEVSADAPASVQAPAPAEVPAKPASEPSEVPDSVKSNVDSQPAAPAEDLPAQNLNVSDSTKAEHIEKKKFSVAPLKKVGPIRLVKGFRTPQLRPRISLESQKEAADTVRQWMYERRNKYEKFVDNVLGKASPVNAKQPAPGADSSLNNAAAALAAIGVATPSPLASIPLEAQRDPSGK